MDSSETIKKNCTRAPLESRLSSSPTARNGNRFTFGEGLSSLPLAGNGNRAPLGSRLSSSPTARNGNHFTKGEGLSSLPLTGNGNRAPLGSRLSSLSLTGNGNINSTSDKTYIDTDLSSKISSLDAYYNLVSEKVDFYCTTHEELEEKCRKIKHKIYLLTHNIRKNADKLDHIYPREWIVEHSLGKSCNGGSVNKNSWTEIPLNSIDSTNVNDDTSVCLNENHIKLCPGEYFFNIQVTLFRTGSSKIRLYDRSENETLYESLAHYAAPDHDSGHQVLEINKLIIIEVPTEVSIDYIVQYDVPNYGLGLGTGFSDKEVFTRCRITKIV